MAETLAERAKREAMTPVAAPLKPQSMKAVPAPQETMAQRALRESTPQYSEEQGVSFDERMALKNFGNNNPEAQAEWLSRAPGEGGKPQGITWIPGANFLNMELPSWAYTSRPKQYETDIHEGRVYVRPKGEQGAFKAVDPNKADLQDVTDLGTDIASLLPTGRALNTAMRVGGIETGRRAGGALLYGFNDNPLEIAKDAAIQGTLAGGVQKGLEKLPDVVRGAGKLLQKGERLYTVPTGEAAQAAARTESKAIGAQGAELAAKRAKLAGGMKETRGATAEPLNRLQQARAAQEAARLRALTEAEAEADQLAAKAAARKPPQRPKPMPDRNAEEFAPDTPGGPVPKKNVLEELEAIAPREGQNRFTFDGSFIDPRNSHAAVILNKVPWLRRLYQEVWGHEFAPDLGGVSQGARTSRIANMAPDEFKRRSAEWTRRLAETVLDSQEAAQLAPHVRRSLGRVLQGGKLAQDMELLNDAVSAFARKTRLPEHLRAANRAVAEAKVPAAEARATRSQARAGVEKGQAALAPEESKLAARRAAFRASEATREPVMTPWKYGAAIGAGLGTLRAGAHLTGAAGRLLERRAALFGVPSRYRGLAGRGAALGYGDSRR